MCIVSLVSNIVALSRGKYEVDMCSSSAVIRKNVKAGIFFLVIHVCFLWLLIYKGRKKVRSKYSSVAGKACGHYRIFEMLCNLC